MTSVAEIENAIEKLTPPEIDTLKSWLDERYQDKWDQEIAADLDNGQLDDLINRAKQQYKDGKFKAL